MWNQFYDAYPPGSEPGLQDFNDFTTLIDDTLGDLFDPPVR